MSVIGSPGQAHHSPFSRNPPNLRGKKKFYYAACLFILGLLCIAKLDNIQSTTSLLRNREDYSTSSTAMNRHTSILHDTKDDHETISQWYSTFPEKIIPSTERKKDHKIRYAAFGSSQTWGATLADRDTEAYVKKLSLDHSENYGIRSSGPNYPAACTHSIMGDQEFDVIIMEYFTVADTGLMELAQRLRERFPDAILVIARFWNTPMLVNKNGEELRHWGNGHEYGSGFIHEEAFKKEFIDTFEENQWKWMFHIQHPEFLVIHEAIAKATGSYILEMEGWGAEDAFGENGYLEIGDKMLGPDSFHLSAAAHEDFANKVKALVDRVGVPKNPTIQDFSSVDYCLNWFQTGEIGEGLKSSDNAVVRKMPNTEKYGMEFDGDEPGWIEMTNPSEKSMYIFVAYMTTGPAPSKYPKTVATREDGTTKTSIDPLADWGGNPNIKVHVSSLMSFGEVKAGQTARISFEALEKTEWPFRIVQAVLTDRESFGSSYFTMPDSSRRNGIADTS